jgi:hypothetical protein
VLSQSGEKKDHGIKAADRQKKTITTCSTNHADKNEIKDIVLIN